MEVMIPNSPQTSQPSSPKGFMGGGYYFSAPTSPSHHLSHFYAAESSRIDWEEKPGTPKSASGPSDPFDFAFDVSEDWGKSSLSAEELFDSGVIKPLTPPPRLQNSAISAKTPTPNHHHRGREREGNLPKSSSRRAARSLSPLRGDSTRNKYPWLEEEEVVAIEKSDSVKNQSRLIINDVGSSGSSTAKGSKKWRLKDFFLFRSASEGRAADKDPLKKYTAAYRHSSFRANDGTGSRRRGPPVSPHERHYTANRAVSEDLKKKTFLPYKQGILGRLSFNPAVHALANGFGFSKKS